MASRNCHDAANRYHMSDLFENNCEYFHSADWCHEGLENLLQITKVFTSSIIEGPNLPTLTHGTCSSSPSIKKPSKRDAIPHEKNTNFIVCLHLAQATRQLHGDRQEGEIHWPKTLQPKQTCRHQQCTYVCSWHINLEAFLIDRLLVEHDLSDLFHRPTLE